MFFELFHRYRNVLVALLLIAAPMALIATRAGAEVGQSKQTRAGNHARGALAWGQVGVTGVIGGAGAWLGGLLGGATREENKKLRADLDRMREENARLIGVLQENQRLRKLVGFKQEHPEFEVVPARVISRNTSPYFRVIQIRIRAEGKIKPRQPVVVTGGVIGQVHTVQGKFADVILLADPRSRIDAISQRNRAHGVVQGLGHERDYRAKVAYLGEKDVVKAGDLMVTSGMGGVFPAELIVGTVREVTPDERGLFQNVVLEPAVDLSRVQEVFVITRIKVD